MATAPAETLRSGPASNALHAAAVDEVPKAAPRLREGAEKISCPFLASAYNVGELNPDETGFISNEAVNALMLSKGFNEKATEFFVAAADNADPELKDGFNLFEMRNNSLNHTGSTGIRDNGVNPSLMPAFLAHGENGRMYERHFAAAANATVNNPAGQGNPKRGTAVQTLEFTTALQVFGRKDSRGELYLTNDDIIGLWLRNVYPKDWKPRPPNDIEFTPLVGNTASMGASRIWQGIAKFFSRLF